MNVNETITLEQAIALAHKFLDLPEPVRRILIDEVIANEEEHQAAIDRGNWSHYAMLSAMRAKVGLPPVLGVSQPA